MISLVGLYSQKALEAEEKEQLCGELLQRMWYDSFPCVVLESESLGRGLTKAGGLWHPPSPLVSLAECGLSHSALYFCLGYKYKLSVTYRADREDG